MFQYPAGECPGPLRLFHGKTELGFTRVAFSALLYLVGFIEHARPSKAFLFVGPFEKTIGSADLTQNPFGCDGVAFEHFYRAVGQLDGRIGEVKCYLEHVFAQIIFGPAELMPRLLNQFHRRLVAGSTPFVE